MTSSNPCNRRLERLSFLHLMLLTLPWVGIMSIWTTEFGIITPVLESYGLKGSLASLTWIFGPLTGFFTAPVVGAMSDRCTSKYGRRRPFILVGLFMTLIASAVLSFTYTMGQFKIYVCFISFLILDITINVMQTPMRAFNSDLVPDSQQGVVQLLVVLFQGIGGVLGLGLMKLLWTGTDASEMPQLIGIVMLINSVLIGITCVLISETPLHPPPNNGTCSAMKRVDFVQTMLDIFKSIPTLDTRMKLVCGIQFLSWIALFSWWPTASTWFARNVFQGCTLNDANCTDQGQALYQEGTALYALSGLYAYLVQTLISLVLAVCMQLNSGGKFRIPYAFCLLVGSVVMMLAKFGPSSANFAFGIAVFMAVPVAAINSFPFAIVGRIHAEQVHSDVGRDFGTLNIFICLPQFIITFVISGFRAVLGNDGLPWVLVIAGVMLVLAAGLALFLNENRRPSLAADFIDEFPEKRADEDAYSSHSLKN